MAHCDMIQLRHGTRATRLGIFVRLSTSPLQPILPDSELDTNLYSFFFYFTLGSTLLTF
jgi:hypothetical protein